MSSEYRKSINQILKDRISGPFYGTFIIAWTGWNWNLVYVTLFISEDRLAVTKIDYINQFVSFENSIVYPTLITFFLLIIGSIFSYLGYLILLLHTKYKLKAKGVILDKDRLLTKDESNALRRELFEMESQFERQISAKENHIVDLRRQMDLASEQVQTMKLSERGFKVIYAQYGTIEKNFNVTDQVRRTLGERGNGELKVENETFGSDPDVGKKKYLWITCQQDGNVSMYIKPEHQIMKISRPPEF